MKAVASLLAVAFLLQQANADSSANQVAKASNTFSNSLYEKVAKEPGNVLVCPISLHVALGLVLQGAGSNTSTELSSVLGFHGVNPSTKDSYKSLLTGIKDNTLKIATQLYPSANYDLSASFVSVAQEYFLSGVEGADFSKPAEAASKINKYVEDHTNNKIHNLISPDSISDQTRLIVVNAVHFQATWKKTFNTAYNDYFKVSPTEKVMTKMMSITDYFDYKEDPALDAKVLKMDYTDGGYSMLFVLPNKEDGLPALEEKLVHTDLDKLLENLREQKVEVSIPKFKLEKTINLKDILISMGIKEIFSSRADLKGIANGDSLYVSDVIQKTFINVHENGTEAAAATGLLIELLSAGYDNVMFVARWPFYFTLVRSQRPTMRLFSGRLVRPPQVTRPQEKKHSDHNNDERIHFREGSSGGGETITNSDQNFTPSSQFLTYPQQSHITPTHNQNNINLSPTPPTTPQYNEINAENTNIKSDENDKQNQYHQSHVHTTYIPYLDETTTEIGNIPKEDPIRHTHPYPSRIPTADKQNTNNLPQTQRATTQINQLSTEDYKRQATQFLHELQEFYRQQQQPFQNSPFLIRYPNHIPV